MISRNLSSNTYEQSKENFKKSAILFDSFLRDPQVKYSLWHIPTPLNPKKIKGPLQMSAWGTKEHNSFFSLLHYMFLLDFSFLCLCRANDLKAIAHQLQKSKRKLKIHNKYTAKQYFNNGE